MHEVRTCADTSILDATPRAGFSQLQEVSPLLQQGEKGRTILVSRLQPDFEKLLAGGFSRWRSAGLKPAKAQPLEAGSSRLTGFLAPRTPR
jgi:hypothetical protein